MVLGIEGDGTGPAATCFLLSLSTESLFGVVCFSAGVTTLGAFNGDGRMCLATAGAGVEGAFFKGRVPKAGRGKCGGDLAIGLGLVGFVGSGTGAGRIRGGRIRDGTGRGWSVAGAVVVGRGIEPKRNHGRGS